jgi:ParB-like chromosome segregation protein Spo0J
VATEEKHNIRPEIADRKIPIGDVQPHPENYNSGRVPEIAESLRLNKQYRSIVVQKQTGRIVAGNNTWKAARLLGWTHIAAELLDLSHEEARKILLADNKLARDSEFDERALAELLGSLEDLEGTGWSDEEFVKLVEGLDDDSEDLPEPGDADTDDLENTWGVIITCGTEDEQVEMLQRFTDEGLNVRAIVG